MTHTMTNFDGSPRSVGRRTGYDDTDPAAVQMVRDQIWDQNLNNWSLDEYSESEYDAFAERLANAASVSTLLSIRKDMTAAKKA